MRSYMALIARVTWLIPSACSLDAHKCSTQYCDMDVAQACPGVPTATAVKAMGRYAAECSAKVDAVLEAPSIYKNQLMSSEYEELTEECLCLFRALLKV